MIELPEAVTLAEQINKTVNKKIIQEVIAGYTDHKLVWYYGNKNEYLKLLKGKGITGAASYGGLVEISAENIKILFGDGVNLRYLESESDIPEKHQLLVGFTDGTYLCASVQMYGGLGCFEEGGLHNEYYIAAKGKPSPLSGEFNSKYFSSMIKEEKVRKLSLKALLATEQRIPGLGNGVLQDILFNAKLHPKKKVDEMNENQSIALFNSVKETLKRMTDNNGRDTEKDLMGNPGGYKTILSRNTVGKSCKICSSKIVKTSYMGGSIYFCPGCQEE